MTATSLQQASAVDFTSIRRDASNQPRCISGRQMTDNIFQTETTAKVHRACALEDSAITLTDFAGANPSVDHRWIFEVHARAQISPFLSNFLARINVFVTMDEELVSMFSSSASWWQ